MNWIVIANPASGRGRATRLAGCVVEEIEQTGVRASVCPTLGPGHAGELARKAADRDEGVAVCGGDGTLHEVVNAVDLQRLTLGVIPSGRGNDFARMLGLLRDAREIGRWIGQARRRQVDVGLVGSTRFLTVACAGLDARVAMRMRSGWWRSRWAYRFGAVVEILKGLDVTLEVRKDETTETVLLAAFANGAFYGGGLAIAPEAEIDDGWIDVCEIAPVGRLTALGLLRHVETGRHHEHAAVRLSRSRSAYVDAPAGQPIVADGELVATVPATISVLPGALTVVVPPASG